MEIDDIKRHPDSIRFYLDRVKFKREGREYKALCCFHSEKTGSLTLYQKEGIWLYFCHGCGASGNCVQFVERHDKIPFNSALKLCREQLEKSWGSQKDAVEKVFKPFSESGEKQYKTYPESEYKKLEQALQESPEAKTFLLSQRGISLETAQRLRFGFRQDVGKLAGSSNDDIAARGWISFPTLDSGHVTSVKYRSIVRKAFCKQPGCGTFLFNTQAIDFLEPLYVVEGEFDVAALDQIGLRAISVPNATTTITPEMKDQMLQAECVILAGDCDNAAGTKLMQKLWAEMNERTYLLQWPTGMKDANQTFLEHCKRDLSVFRTCVAELTAQARSTPMPGIFSLQESMVASEHTSLTDHPNRLRFPWPSVDKMAILLPGSVLSVFATNTGMGKTTWIANVTLDAARKQGEIVLNYQCELNTSEFANMAAAYVLRKNRNALVPSDYLEASKLLQGVKYYIGRNPTLTTVAPVLDLIEAGIRRLGATLVVLDHLHYVCVSEENEVQAQAAAMQRLKNMAVKYGCKVIIAGQPRKANSQQKGKVVHITDAKGSEAFTSDADVVIALHRNVLKNIDPDNPPRDMYDPITEIHLQKARAKGEGGAFARLLCIGELAAFAEIAPEPTGNLYGK